MILHRIFLMDIMTCVTMQAASSAALRSHRNTPKEFYVCYLQHFTVIEVVPNSETPIVLRGHVSDKRMSCRFLCTLGVNVKNYEIIL